MFARTIFLWMLLGAPIFAAAVTLQRVPEGGLQPHAAVDDEGTAHLIFYKGAERGGDVFYSRQKSSESNFSKPLRVNSRPGSAMSIGTIRGAQLSLGKNRRAHVIWNGGQGAKPAMIEGAETTPLVYARMNDVGDGFEPERNLLTYAGGLDGGSSIAADNAGNVYATWHGRAPGAAEGEAGRAVFIARSTDEGKTFARETPATNVPTGACGCCGMRAFADDAGAVYILYRGAAEKVNRDEILLVSPKPGAPFTIANKHAWVVDSCPMSSAFISQGRSGVLAAWETSGQIFFVTVSAAQVGRIQSPPGTAKRKHPVAVSNARGEILVAWTEGTGWARGGTAHWQVFGKNGAPELEQGRGENLPAWDLVAAFAKPDGSFVVIY
jgi:hypothetical protein